MIFNNRTSRLVVLGITAILLTFASGVCQAKSKGGHAKNEDPVLAKQEDNKKIVIAFYNKALNDKDPDEALKFVGPIYTQHNPTAGDGREGFRKFILWVRSDHPDSHSEIKQIFADGDYVILNVHMIRFPGERGLAIGEIFRLENGKIVEHWDRIQPVPESAKNNNGMF